MVPVTPDTRNWHVHTTGLHDAVGIVDYHIVLFLIFVFEIGARILCNSEFRSEFEGSCDPEFPKLEYSRWTPVAVRDLSDSVSDQAIF